MDNTEKTIFDAELTEVPEDKKVIEMRRPWLDWSVGGRDYKLKLTTSAIRKLEQQLKRSLLSAVLDDGIPPISIVITVLQGALQKYHHGITSEKVEEMLDDYFGSGKTQITLLQEVIYPLMHDAGFFTEAMMKMMTSAMDDVDSQL